VTKENSRQNELLRSFCQAHAQVTVLLGAPYFLFSNFISNRDLTLPKKLVACDAALGRTQWRRCIFRLLSHDYASSK
jgi:hypothetical protein